MTGIRLSLGRPGAPAAELVSIAGTAERYNLPLWLGDPDGVSVNSDDSYVLATAAAIAAKTRDMRIGLWLNLRGPAPAIRIAEDLGVIDQISSGRLTVGLVAPVAADPHWRALAMRVLNSWHGWPLPDGRMPAVTPPPAQPVLPTVILGDAQLAGQLGCGVASFGDAHVPESNRRNILIHREKTAGTAAIDKLRDPDGCLQMLRDIAARAGNAREIVFLLDQPEVTEADLKALGMVLAPSLRASAGDRSSLPRDAWNWMTEKQRFHSFPTVQQ